MMEEDMNVQVGEEQGMTQESIEDLGDAPGVVVGDDLQAMFAEAAALAAAETEQAKEVAQDAPAMDEDGEDAKTEAAAAEEGGGECISVEAEPEEGDAESGVLPGTTSGEHLETEKEEGAGEEGDEEDKSDCAPEPAEYDEEVGEPAEESAPANQGDEAPTSHVKGGEDKKVSEDAQAEVEKKVSKDAQVVGAEVGVHADAEAMQGAFSAGAEEEPAEEKKETFPNQLEAMLDGILAKHNAVHPPPDTPDEEEEESNQEGEEKRGADGEVQREGEMGEPAKAHEDSWDVDESAVLKIQALAREGRDRQHVKQLCEDHAQGEENGVIDAEAEAEVDAENEVKGEVNNSKSSEDLGARSSDEEGGAEEEEEEVAVAAAVESVETGDSAKVGEEEGSPVESPTNVDEGAVIKIQALARGKRDRQHVQGLREEKSEKEGVEGGLDTLVEAAVSVCAAAPVHVGLVGEDTDNADEEEEEEEERPRLSFAKPIFLHSSLTHAPQQTEEQGEEPVPKLSFAAPMKINAQSPPKELHQPATEEHNAEEKEEEEEVMFVETAKPPQSLDIWMAECDGDATMEAEQEEDEVEEEETDPAVQPHRQDDPSKGRGHASCSSNASPALQSPVVMRSSAFQDSRGGGGSPLSSHRAVVVDKITQGLQQKLKAVEDKVMQLQQQLLEQLSGGGDLDDDDANGEEEVVAALNERVEKLIRMRAQIMLALEHQKAVTAVCPPSTSRTGMASPRAARDTRTHAQHDNATTLPISYQHGYRPDQDAFLGAGGGSGRRGGSASSSEHVAQENRVPPPLKLPKDLSLKPIRGTSRVPPAMFQRNKPPPPVAKLYEKYPEEPRAPSREIAPPGGSKVPRKFGKPVSHAGMGGVMDAGKEGGHTNSYDGYNGAGHMGMCAGEEDVKVSFKVLSDQRGSNVANRSHGRAAAIAAQERELRFNKEQGVLNNIVRNQVSLENRYTSLNKDAERAAKLQRINHAPRAAALFKSGASATKGPPSK